MARSKGRKNSVASPALSAVAMDVNRSRTSCPGSASSAIGASSKARKHFGMRALCSIAGVDANVAFRKIAGPEARLAFAFASDHKPDLALRGIELRLQPGLVEWRGQPARTDAHVLHVDIHLARIECDSGVPGGAEDAAPVRIGACYCGLDQW